MRTILEKLESSHLTLNESAWLRCQAALEYKDRGDYEGAREIMRPFWPKFGERPDLEGLDPAMRAEMLLHVGILTRWIGSKNQLSYAQDTAKDLINESIRMFESLRDSLRVAAARTELGLCYWWAGALDEARIMLTEAYKNSLLKEIREQMRSSFWRSWNAPLHSTAALSNFSRRTLAYLARFRITRLREPTTINLRLCFANW